MARPNPIRLTPAPKRKPSSATPAANKGHDFVPRAFLESIALGRKFLFFPRKRTIFSQGDPADAVFCVQSGKVRFTVVSKTGKEATIGIFGEHDFLAKARLPASLSAWERPLP
jgi:CRP-like cAMP-binding protein